MLKVPWRRNSAARSVSMHGLDQPIPAPLSVGFMNWEDDPYGGAWRTWRSGREELGHHEEHRGAGAGTALHIVGEAWSTNQGWVEGALETAEGPWWAR